ncbi:MAG TPA: ribosome maturation factor RimM [Candidatus Kapabacteria bacterium]|nr:ribosome maturation factor RimM [Candidatus Kapabacteria bacterium]
MPTDDLILIAVIRKPHGVRGEVSCESYTFDNTRFKKLSVVSVRLTSGELLSLTLTGFRETPKAILLTFKEIGDRNEADKFRNAEILIPANDRLPLPDGKAYYDEYPGMKVLDAETNKEIGLVGQILEGGAGPILSISLHNGSTRLTTMAGEEIRRVDRTARTVFVSLLEEY